ncbi:MAG TPA: hypothetical protein VHX65_19280 [Pirellulales bacterium]|jgi:hypothetical protein|nr:hypothetical protein [Pirellulales bacterium]
MSWWVEDSTPVLVWGCIVEVILIFALVKSGRLWLLYAMAGLALLVGGIVWHEKHTITDTKQIRASLYQAAAEMERNNLPGVLQYISPTAPDLVRQAKSISSTFKLDEVHLTNLKIQVNRFNHPPSATVDFFVRVSGADRAGNFPFANILQRAQVTMQLENGRWLVSGYTPGGINGR